MNSHLIQQFSNEKFMEVMRSIELFVAIIFVTSLLALICLSVA